MDKLIQTLELLRSRLPGLRNRDLKETPPRTILVDPILEALGWDIRDPDEVELEYPTIDGKSVDYALKLNKKPVLLVEAKPLRDPLDDVKGITQVVGYAANDGIDWCVLTNGINWRVYRSMEQCAAPDKLLFEVDVAPESSEDLSIQQTAAQLWRLSAEEMAGGTLDTLGEAIFTDGKVRKALHGLLADPPRGLLTMIHKVVGDTNLHRNRIRDSLARIAKSMLSESPASSPLPDIARQYPTRRRAGEKSRFSQGREPPRQVYSEEHHLGDKPKEVVELYRALDRGCMTLGSDTVTREYLAKYIAYRYLGRNFCSVHILRRGLRIWLPLRLVDLSNPPHYARDVSHVGHWGTGDVELRISMHSELAGATDLVRRAYDAVASKKR